MEQAVVVTLIKSDGQLYRQGTTKAGYLRLSDVVPAEYTLRVVAPGFAGATKQIETESSTEMKVTVQMEPATGEIDTAPSAKVEPLPSKAQKALDKAIEALRTNKLGEARSALDDAYGKAPKSAEVQYLYGVYASLSGDHEHAKSCWMKALELDPQHLRALISLSEAYLGENRPGEAEAFAERAVRAEPSSWRAHEVSAEASLNQGSLEEAIREAERALELGHGQAAAAQPVLAAALNKRAERDRARAAALLQAYLQEHSADAAAKEQLASLQIPAIQIAASEPGHASAAPMRSTTEALASRWLPPDIDEKAGAVEPGAVCALEEVVRKAGIRIQEFVSNVDRFAATESIKHESINKSGIPAHPETRKFDYLVSIQEVKSGFFDFQEYRTGGDPRNQFPEGIASNGLPALVLIFHPHNVENFGFTCEGLARSNSGLAWQVHFRQRDDKPNTIRRYRLGVGGPSYGVTLKGRAWIAADSYQIVRMETQEVAPVPEIRLVTDRTVIEYGPVHFRDRDLEMWLPQSAEVYVDWRGRRFRRRHSFNNYLLFSVDEKQHISQPKADVAVGPNPTH